MNCHYLVSCLLQLFTLEVVPMVYLRDRSLISRRELQNVGGGEGAFRFYPYTKEERRGTNFEVVLIWLT